LFTMQQDARQQQIEDERARQAQKIENQRAESAREVEEQRAQDAALQAYLDQMSQLMLEGDLRGSEEGSEVRILARARTRTVLTRLDSRRKGSVVQFLYEASLINKERPVVSLSAVSLRGADLSGLDLTGADLINVNLTDTDLSGADLSEADLSEADLYNANLYGANVYGADLMHADLSGADARAAGRTAGGAGGAGRGGARPVPRSRDGAPGQTAARAAGRIAVVVGHGGAILGDVGRTVTRTAARAADAGRRGRWK